METRRHTWEDVLDEDIRALTANYAARKGLGERPALLCIDNYNAVFGDRRQPLREAMVRFPSSCGFAGWDALEPTKQLMAAARSAGIPVIHTTSDLATTRSVTDGGATKRANSGRDPEWDFAHFAPLAPEAGELVIRKARASAFFGTALTTFLLQMDVNTLLVCGNSTSGCVRATVNDASMHGYKVGVVEECVFDRNWLSHKVNLYDMNTKYADAVFLDEALAYIRDHSESAKASSSANASADPRLVAAR